MAYFPMYINIENQNCIVVGGGKIAFQKVKVLHDFGAKVEVVAEKFCEEMLKTVDAANKNCSDLKNTVNSGNIILNKRSFDIKDIEGKVIVVAATNDKQLNHHISVKCKEKNIPVNAVDQKEDCTFIFPSYVKEKNLVASFSSSGNSPLITQVLKQKEKDILTPELGELNEKLGKARSYAAEKISDADLRKEVYRKIFERFEKSETMISDEQIREIIDSNEI